MKDNFNYDFYRYYKRDYINKDFLLLLTHHDLLFIYLFRKSKITKNKLMKIIIKFLLRKIRLRYGIEIDKSVVIGPGFYMGHPYNITINPETILGSNINIHKGVTIGKENRGGRKGAPIIGNDVWIGVNSTIVGKIKIGNNVLIAPNTYCNKDVPNDSIVIGNPCIIKENIEATKGYINKRIEV
ncbi:MAG: serine acetyltransferase [Fusobacterium sp. JB019]|nr:serine acetyltransferase [Fusobacterium sp. JB019]